jgi:hypothetical protein
MRRSLKHFKVSVITLLKIFSSHCFTDKLVVFSQKSEVPALSLAKLYVLVFRGKNGQEITWL